MKKTSALIFGIAFAFVMIMSLASATLTLSSIPTLNHTNGSFKINVTSDRNETVNISISEIVQGTKKITFTESPTTFELNATDDTKEVIINYNIDSGFLFELGKSYSTILTLHGNVSGNQTQTITFEESDYCNGVKNQGNLEIRDMNFDVITGYGDSSDYWYLMDQVEVEVEVNNRGSWDVQNVQVSWEIDTTAGEKIMDGDVNDFDLNYGDDSTVTISFKLDQDFRRFENENAVFYVKASGKIDDQDSQYDSQETCAFDKEEIDIRTRDDFMIVESVKINGEQVEKDGILSNTITCNSNLDISGLVYNIGRDKQKESYFEVYNKELGFGEIFDLSDINGFSSENFDFQLNVPKDAKEKLYPLTFVVHEKNGDAFQNQEDDEAITNVFFRVVGACKIADPTITVNLDSTEVVAGKDMIVKVTLRNDDVKNATFTVNADGFSSWATLKEVNPETFVLTSGTVEEVYLTFNLKDSSAGDQNFNLIVTGNGYILANKPVLVSVQESLSFAFFNDFFDTLDWKVWGIVALNLILLIAIIIVARHVLRKK